MFQINGTITLAPGTIANSPETVEAIKTLVAASRAEDGCYVYTVAPDITDSDSLVIFERWRDEKAMKAHSKSAHMAEFQKTFAKNPPIGRDLRLFETDDGKPL